MDAVTETPYILVPGTHVQWAWDATSIEAFILCPRYYQYTILEGWTGNRDNIHLRWGIEFTRALEDYDRSIAAKIKHNDAVFDVVKALLERIREWNINVNEEKRSEKLKTKSALVYSVISYLDHYKEDPAKTYILRDETPAVEVNFKFELDWGPDFGTHDKVTKLKDQPYVLCGYLDKVVEFQGDIFIMDHKTTVSTLSDYYFKQFDLSTQMTLYTLAGRVVFGMPVRGAIIDAAQIMDSDTRFVRSLTYRTQDQLDEWVSDLHYIFATAEDYAAEGYWPMNLSSCSKYGGCRFAEICSKSPSVRDKFLKSNFVQRPKEERWNPLMPR